MIKLNFYVQSNNWSRRMNKITRITNKVVKKKTDLNFDNNVNIIDIVDIVYVILDDTEIQSEYLWAGDMDYSSDLNVIDITKLVNFIFLP